VESIAAKSSKDLTELIEQISGSIELREEYERLQSQKDRAEENTIYNYQKKKGANAEKKQLKLQKDEADLFQKKKQELAEKKQKHTLWQLFHIEKETKAHTKEKESKQGQLEEIKGKQSLVAKELKRVKQEQAKVHSDSLALEKKIRKQADTEGKSEEIRIKEEVQFITKRRTASLASLTKLNTEYDKQQKAIDSLREQIKVLEKASKDLDKELEKLKKVKEITLERDQIEEYNAR
jgi:structural maintenance of chromosome 1